MGNRLSNKSRNKEGTYLKQRVFVICPWFQRQPIRLLEICSILVLVQGAKSGHGRMFKDTPKTPTLKMIRAGF